MKSAIELLESIADDLASGESDEPLDENFVPLMIVVRASRYLHNPDGYRRKGLSSVTLAFGAEAWATR